jgi:hypothetical protein
MEHFKKKYAIILCSFLFSLSFAYGIFVKAEDVIPGVVNSANEGTDNRIAPGEFLPVSIKLVNFGSLKRVDVTVTYSIFNSNSKEIYSENETVAVETTASFVKRIQLPYTIEPGMYTLRSSLQYPYQEAPAVSSFLFKVEKKIGSFFVSDVILYGLILVLLLFVGFGVMYVTISAGKKSRVRLHDYSDKPKDQIIYYEMLSDTIMQMRLRVGDAAVDIATHIDGLIIDPKTGKILKITGEPSKIMALLVSGYDKIFGKKVSFSLRSDEFKN